MKGTLRSIGMASIADGTIPNGMDATELKDWVASDARLSGYFYGQVSDEYQHLIKDAEAGSTAWAALKANFERSTIGYRMTARAEFYEITHDPSRPISAYLQSLQAAKQKLAAYGVKIEDTEFKDVLLMRLDESFHPVRFSILSQSPEPDLAKIKVMLTSSTAADPISIKLEGAYAARGRNAGSGDGLVDDKGFHWCNANSDGCHRCGRKGHRALNCIYDMPRKVKDHIMKNPRPRSASSSHTPHRNSVRTADATVVHAAVAARAYTHTQSSPAESHSPSPDHEFDDLTEYGHAYQLRHPDYEEDIPLYDDGGPRRI